MSSPVLRALDIAAMTATDPPPVPWIVNGLVARGGLTILVGCHGTGKSLLAMALAAAVVTGDAVAGIECCTGTSAIINAENGEAETHRRVRTLGLPAAGVAVYEAMGFDLRRNLDLVDEVLKRDRPDLLVINGFRSCWRGDENDSGEVAAVLNPLRALLRRYNAGAIILHHTGKTGTYRGSSAIGDSAEVAASLARHDGAEDPARRKLSVWKCRPAPEPPIRWLRLSIERDLVFIDEAAPPEAISVKMGRPSIMAAEIVPQILRSLREGPARQAELARALGRSPSDGSVRRLLAELEKRGEVHQLADGRWALPEVEGRRVDGTSGSASQERPA